MDKKNVFNFSEFSRDRATEVTIPTLINDKRVHFIARHLIRSSEHHHCTYVEFMKLDFPFFDYPKKYYGENNFRYSLSEFIDKIDGHSYCSYYDESEVNGKIMVKIGWDYSHSHDDNYRSENNINFIVEHDLKSLYDSFVELSNKCKENKRE